MDHTDAAHQTRNDFYHITRIAFGQWSEIFVQSVEVTDIVLRFVGSVCDSAVKLLPVVDAARLCSVYDIHDCFDLTKHCL